MRRSLEPVRSRRSALWRLSGIVIASVLGLTITVSGLSVSPAVAADPSEFDPGYIISDALFYDGGAMTKSQIQSFLQSKVGTCQNSLCLNVLSAPTFDKPKDRDNCDAYDGGGKETAAAIIYKVQVACGISARVILTTLQKEQGLVTHTAPTKGRLAAAMGWNCPDSAPCNAETASFFKQVYGGAWQFKRYRSSVDGNFGKYRPGTRYDVRYSPNSSCGTKKVSISNWATAGLYNYTPYTPNSAALSNLYGTGNSCSSYGNRNFWRIYTDWFGSPIGRLSSDVVASRVAGADRFATSVAISQVAYPDPSAVTTVFVASGRNFPDGLAAGPAAALAGSPLLLTEKSSLPSVIRDEIKRLAPEQIFVVGGPPAVSSTVVARLEKIAPVTRLSGDNRFKTSYAIARAAFPDGATDAFVAIGENFPDALAASAAAGKLGAPVILVPQGASSANSATRSLLADLGVTRVIAAGSKTVIKSSYLTSLRTGTSVTDIVRLGGADRYKTAALINEFAFPEATVSYLASGVNFPDALSAAAVAGAQGAALHLSPGKCLPSSSVIQLTQAGVEQLIFVGSSKVLSSSAFGYKPC